MPPVDPIAHPFLKWVGGKRQLVPKLLCHVPARIHTYYYEPFLGGGALFWAVRDRARRAVIGDVNLRLVRTWCVVRDQCEALILRLGEMSNTPDFFLAQRARAIDAEPDVEVAAWMIFLNRTAFNGLYRVNRRGQFNVPFGRYQNPTLCDADNLRAASAALQGTMILHADFAESTAMAAEGDFVYFDPPYVPLSATSAFTAYTGDGFGAEEQARLRDVALALKRRGVRVLLSNSSAGLVRDLYSGPDFTVEEVMATRRINCVGTGRGPVKELVIW